MNFFKNKGILFFLVFFCLRNFKLFSGVVFLLTNALNAFPAGQLQSDLSWKYRISFQNVREFECFCWCRRTQGSPLCTCSCPPAESLLYLQLPIDAVCQACITYVGHDSAASAASPSLALTPEEKQAQLTALGQYQEIKLGSSDLGGWVSERRAAKEYCLLRKKELEYQLADTTKKKFVVFLQELQSANRLFDRSISGAMQPTAEHSDSFDDIVTMEYFCNSEYRGADDSNEPTPFIAHFNSAPQPRDQNVALEIPNDSKLNIRNGNVFKTNGGKQDLTMRINNTAASSFLRQPYNNHEDSDNQSNDISAANVSSAADLYMDSSNSDQYDSGTTHSHEPDKEYFHNNAEVTDAHHCRKPNMPNSLNEEMGKNVHRARTPQDTAYRLHHDINHHQIQTKVTGNTLQATSNKDILTMNNEGRVNDGGTDQNSMLMGLLRTMLPPAITSKYNKSFSSSSENSTPNLNLVMFPSLILVDDSTENQRRKEAVITEMKRRKDAAWKEAARRLQHAFHEISQRKQAAQEEVIHRMEFEKSKKLDELNMISINANAPKPNSVEAACFPTVFFSSNYIATTSKTHNAQECLVFCRFQATQPCIYVSYGGIKQGRYQNVCNCFDSRPDAVFTIVNDESAGSLVLPFVNGYAFISVPLSIVVASTEAPSQSYCTNFCFEVASKSGDAPLTWNFAPLLPYSKHAPCKCLTMLPKGQAPSYLPGGAIGLTPGRCSPLLFE